MAFNLLMHRGNKIDHRRSTASSGVSSRSSSPVPSQRQTRNFDPDASILFIGPRKSGKSSLAVIAATALQRDVVDADKYVSNSSRLTNTNAGKSHDSESHLVLRAELLSEVLYRYDKNCVITCEPYAISVKGRKFLQHWGISHAIIYVEREADMIERCLKLGDRDQVIKMLQERSPIYQEIANYEYFNLEERWPTMVSLSSEDGLHDILPDGEFRRKSLQTLQNTKRDMTRFLNLAFGMKSSKGHFQTLHPSAPDMRSDTVALSLPAYLIESPDVSLTKLEGGHDAIELVIDLTLPLLTNYFASGICDTIGRSVAIIRRQLSLPVIYHFQIDSIDDSELTPRIMQSYFEMLHFGLRSAPEYLAVDLRGKDDDICALIYSRGCTKIIGSLFDRNAQPGSWLHSKAGQDYHRAKRLGCDVVRLYKVACSMVDNFSCLAFMSQINTLSNTVPVIAYNVGSAGDLSSAFNTSLTPVTHPLLEAAKQVTLNGRATPTAPSITSRQIQQILYSTRTFHALNFHVFGSDVNYSLSPAVHNTGFEACGMRHTYNIRQCNSLKEVRDLIQDPNFGGASISMPFKSEAAMLVDSLSASARDIGAVNTLLPVRVLGIHQQLSENPCSKMQRNRAGPIMALHGANTDWMGIYACISRYISPANAPSRQTTAVVIGAGGIARAAIYAMARLGVTNIFIVNRTLENAQNLADHYNSRVQSIYESSAIPATTASSNTPRLTVHILPSRAIEWPEEYKFPTIVVYTIPTRQAGTSGQRDLRAPNHWLRSPTGGLLVDVSQHHILMYYIS